MPENLYPQLPTAPPISQESFNIEMVRKYYQDIANLKEQYTEKQRKYKNAYNRSLHASTSASSVALVSGVSTIGTLVTIVGFPISASLAIVSTVSTCVGACLLLTSKKYKKKLLKCYELLDKITTSLATFETLISLSIDDDSVIDAKEFHKLQTLYLQLMAHVRNIDRKMKVQTEENFQKTIIDEIVNLRKALERKWFTPCNGSRLNGTATSGLEGRVWQLQIKLLMQLQKAFCFLLFWILSRLFP